MREIKQWKDRRNLRLDGSRKWCHKVFECHECGERITMGYYIRRVFVDGKVFRALFHHEGCG